MKRVGKNSKKKKISKWKIAALIASYAVLLIIIAFLLITRISASDAAGADVDAETEDVTFVIQETDNDVPETAVEEETDADKNGDTAVPLDTTAPVIEGVINLTVHVGDSVSYKGNVTVTDDTDPNPQLYVDNSGVDLSHVGEYFVFYFAEDASGNTSYEAARVNVSPQRAITSEEAFAVADEIIANIITDDMTDGEKLTKVYRYLHSLGYVDVDYAEAVDYLENAYYFLTTHRGNCRCYFGASKLILERLGYKTIMIHSFYGAPMTHYWNLVSVDGGETYYHYDPTCWNWGEDGNINMVTDEWLEAYAKEHDYSPLLWEVDDYPATPTEPFEG